MPQTNDVHVVDIQALTSPAVIRAELPLGADTSELVSNARQSIRNIVTGRDDRLLVVVGPCSIHDVNLARDYAEKLVRMRNQFAEELEIVMRVYFEKPRTSVGWKGLINDPHLDGSYDIHLGLRLARQLLIDVAQLGVPAATEMLDPIIPQYIADAVAWTAIGARTTESQTHRQMASGLSMPVGFKNGTDGSVQVAINAILAAQESHRFMGVNDEGMASIVVTTGNPETHLVLRGGKQGPNYDARHVSEASLALVRHHLSPRLMIDCSHDNAGKDHLRQPVVLDAIGLQVAAGEGHIMGVMIESHLISGKQSIPADLKQLVYGQSITDACVDISMTEKMLTELSSNVGSRRRHNRAHPSIASGM